MRLFLMLIFVLGVVGTVAADQSALIPPQLNSLLPKISAGMTEQEVTKVLSTQYPDVRSTVGVWSGQSGYIDFKLDDSFSLSVSFAGSRTAIVPQDFLFYIFEHARKRRVDIRQYSWQEPSVSPDH